MVLDKNIRGITVEIGGDTTGLSDALKDVNSESSALASELRKVEKLLKVDPGNVDMIAQKQELLAKSVGVAAERLERLRSVQEQINQKFKEGEIGEEAYRAFQREVAYAEIAVKNAEKAVDDFGKEADDTGKDVQELTENVEESAEAAEEAGSSFEGLGVVIGAIGATLAAGAAAIAAAASTTVKAMVDMTNQAAVYADDLATISATTGMSTDDLQAYAYAAELVDVSLETLTGSMTKQLRSMTAYQKGTKDVVAAYDALGVAATDEAGNLRDAQTVYWELIDALGKVEDETQRDAYAMQLMGKSARDLVPLIELGADGLNELKDEAKAAGAVLSEETLDSLLEVSDGMERMKSSATAATNQIGTIAAGAMAEWYNGAAGIIQSFTAIVASAVNEGNVSEDLTTRLTDAVSTTVENVTASLPQIFETVGAIAEAVFVSVNDALPQIAQVFTEFLPTLISGVGSALPELVSIVSTLALSIVEVIIDTLPQILECGVQMVAAIISGIGNASPDLIPALVNAIMGMLQSIVDLLPELLDAGAELLRGLVEGILNAIPELIEALPALIDSIVNFVLEAIPEIIQLGIDLFTALVDALPVIIKTIVAVIPEIINSVVKAITENIEPIINAGITLLSAIVKDLPTIIEAITNELPDLITGICDALTANIEPLVKAGVQLFAALVFDIPAIVIELYKAVPGIIGSLVKAIIDSVPALEKAGLDLIKGLWNGISNAGAWLQEKISGFFGGVVDSIKDFFGISSPSKLMENVVGKSLAEGIGVGFGKEMEDVAKDMQKAIPTNFDTEINAAFRHSTGGSSERTFELITPISLGGQKLAKVVSRVQYNTELNRARVAGVTAT